MKLFGSSLILSGTALGAGMLGIPMALAQFGFTVSLILMLVNLCGYHLWLFITNRSMYQN